MSAECFLAYYGLRFAVAPGEREDVERRSDPRVAAARASGLHAYWGDFGGSGYLLFIGLELGVFGAEGAAEALFPRDDLLRLAERTEARLAGAGLGGAPALHLIWEPDS